MTGDEVPAVSGRGAFPSECCGSPTGYWVILNRQQGSEPFDTATHLETVVPLIRPELVELLGSVMDEGRRSIDQPVEQYGPVWPHRFSVKKANQRLATLVKCGRWEHEIQCWGDLSE